MTIRLFDIETQREYVKTWERFEQQEQAAMKGTGPWPDRPKAPEPTLDSREQIPFLHPMPSAAPLGPLTATDPRPQGLIDRDGTSQSTIKGFESRWTSCEEAPAKPFTLK